MKKKIGEIKGVELNAKQMRDLKGGQRNCGGACGYGNRVGKCKYGVGNANCTCTVSGDDCA